MRAIDVSNQMLLTTLYTSIREILLRRFPFSFSKSCLHARCHEEQTRQLLTSSSKVHGGVNHREGGNVIGQGRLPRQDVPERTSAFPIGRMEATYSRLRPRPLYTTPSNDLTSRVELLDRVRSHS
jgi:hypothetical protein